MPDSNSSISVTMIDITTSQNKDLSSGITLYVELSMTIRMLHL